MGDIVEFITFTGHQSVFYKITSSAIQFEVRAPGNAGIGLAKKVGPQCDYFIGLGNDRRSWIKKVRGGNSAKETAETPNILSTQEYRRFWISWNGSSIRLGGDGHANPIVSYNCRAPDINYVTFFAISSHYPTPIHWKVELPPVIKKPLVKSISTSELNWVPIEAGTLVLPDGALIGGYEKENLYVVRAKHRGSLTPGKFVPAEGTAYISWGGDSHSKNVYEVLCGYDCMWVPSTKDRIPVGAVVGGNSESIDHEKLYVGRAKYNDHIIPGKVQPSHKVCYIAYDGKEIGVPNYEILVVPEKFRCANTMLIPHIEVNMEMDTENEEDDNDSVYEDNVEYDNALRPEDFDDY